MNQSFLALFDQLLIQQWIILGVFALVLIIRLLFIILFDAGWLFSRSRSVIANEKATQPISVLLTIRNEAENLQRVLPQLLSINNVKYEAIAVDDYSLDNTYSVLGSFKHKYSHFKISSLNEETRFSVKLAQNIALKAAQNEWVITLPVDIESVDNEWLNGFVQKTSSVKRKVIIGYHNIMPTSHFINLLYRIELYYQQTKSAGFITNGIPFIYFEDNVAFKKQEYFEIGGYGKKTQEPYANLELLINKFISGKQTVVVFNETTRLTKINEVAKDDFLNLIKRSSRIEKYLSFWKRFVIGLETFSKIISLPVFLLSLILVWDLWPILASLIIFVSLLQMIIIKIGQNRLNERKIFIPSLVYGLFMPYYKVVYRWHFNRQFRSQKWKAKN